MEYEARARSVSSRGRAAVSVAAVLSVLVVVVLAGALGSSPAPPSPLPHVAAVPPTRSAEPAASTPSAAVPTAPPSIASPAPPRLVACRNVATTDCRRAVRAALEALAVSGPPVASAVLSDAPMCNDDRDCPPELRSGRPVASVVLTFDDESRAWVNVFEPGPDGVREGSPRAFVAVVSRRFGWRPWENT